MNHPMTLSISNAYTRQALSATREVLGLKQLDGVLNQAGLERLVGLSLPDDQAPALTTEEYARFLEAVANLISNPHAGRKLLRRIGQAWFAGVQRGQPLIFGLAQPVLSLLPLNRRIRFVLESWVAALIRTNPGAEAWIEEASLGIAYVEHTCPACFARQSNQPMCYLTQGALDAAVHWASGKRHAVQETECRAAGPASCRFVIDFAPLPG